VSVHSRGVGAGNSANHSYSLGAAPFARLGDLTDGIHVVRVLYEPTFAAHLAAHPAFAPSALFADTLASGAYAEGGGGRGALGLAGFGSLRVFVDDEAAPALIVPLELTTLLGLGDTDGRAWVGFTAATGADVWQAHDVLAWHFTSLRLPT
jgi:hypothetical protein